MRGEDEAGHPVPREPRGREEVEIRVRPAHLDDEEDAEDRARRDPSAIRAEDTEPYIGLQYIARLFKIVAMIVIVAIVVEIIVGLYFEGAAAVLQLANEVVQGSVLAAMLWGVGDLTLLLIDLGHDVRAARVLLGRMSARSAAEDARTRRSGREEDERTPPGPFPR